MINSRRILWEPWISPFANDLLADGDKKEENNDENNDHNGEYKDSYELAENNDGGIYTSIEKKVIPAFATPVGFFPITEHNYPSKAFNIWIMHTNFRITQVDILKLKEVDGVEAIQKVSRYRLVLTIAQLFDEDIVMYLVEESLNALELHNSDDESPVSGDSKQIKLTPELEKKIQTLKITCEKANYWGILMLPNGETRHITSNEMDEYIAAEIDLYRRTQEAVGGLVLMSTAK